MNRDDIIRMAREAGWGPFTAELYAKHLTTFFKRAYKAGAAAEREACAKVCEEYDANNPYIGQAKACAANIRARGNK